MVLELFCRVIVDFQAVSPRQGAKPACRFAFLMLQASKVLLLTFDKSNKTYSTSDFACRLVFGRNMVWHEQTFM